MCLAMVLDNVISILIEKFAFFTLHFLFQLLAWNAVILVWDDNFWILMLENLILRYKVVKVSDDSAYLLLFLKADLCRKLLLIEISRSIQGMVCVSAERARLWQLSSAPMCIWRELVSQEREIVFSLASDQDVKHQRAELIEKKQLPLCGKSWARVENVIFHKAKYCL